MVLLEVGHLMAVDLAEVGAFAEEDGKLARLVTLV
jgi:hypothetical protein